jgi:pSer/pThr/pTyr-binding forkhead associated (FHA) protein
MSVLETPFELVVVGPGIDATFPLSRQVMTIGRSRAAMPDIEIGDADAAPRHCIVLWNESAGCHALRVFGVTGVCLKGTVVAGDGALHRLSIGDTFRIGATTFTYRAAQPSAAAGQVDDLEATRDPPTVLAAPTSREVYEFEVLPRLAGDGFDWTRPLVNHGPRRRI